MDDLELLRHHEPVVCFTAGELFLPLTRKSRLTFPLLSLALRCSSGFLLR